MHAYIQPTFWSTYRFVLNLSPEKNGRLRLCASRFRTLGREDPHMDLLAEGARRWSVTKLDNNTYSRMCEPPRFENTRFSTRALVEGLIAHGILRPSEVPKLLQALAAVAVVPAFQDRILESLFNEERIRNITNMIRGDMSFKHVCVG